MEASRLPAKISVTELKRRINLLPEDEYTTSTFVAAMIKKPLFLEEEKVLTSAERGTAVHTLMQHIDLKKEINIESVNIQIQQLVKNEILSPERGKVINASRILKFFSSEIGRKMLASAEVKREVPFFIRLKSTEIYKELPIDKYSDEIIILQGIIDCYFIEEGGIVLLDYKTDFVPDGDTGMIAERYRTQMDYYSRALAAMTGQKVKARYIYLFSLDTAIEI
jgi:ATP-dependent helicase/nuclease subunit A